MRSPSLKRQLQSPPSPEHIELFGGAGGLALGLQQAGLKLSRLIEVDPDACETLRANGTGRRRVTRGWRIEQKNISEVSFSDMGYVDLISAGAPCQPFSHGGRRAGDLDARNLFPHVVRALGEVQPRAFVIENVRGLLFHDMELYLRRLLHELRAPTHQARSVPTGARRKSRDEYKLFYNLLNAADFGLPQNRQRLFIVGLKPDLAASWEWPTGTHRRDALVRALLADDYWDRHAVPGYTRRTVRSAIPEATRRGVERNQPAGKRWRTVRDLLATLPEPSRDKCGAADPWHIFVPDARLYPKHTGSKLDWPAKTVKAGVHGCPGGEHIVVFDDGSYRYFTVRECGLLQGFPPRYAFPELRTPAMRQIGNAVPVPVAAAVGKQLVKVLGNQVAAG